MNVTDLILSLVKHRLAGLFVDCLDYSPDFQVRSKMPVTDFHKSFAESDKVEIASRLGPLTSAHVEPILWFAVTEELIQRFECDIDGIGSFKFNRYLRQLRFNPSPFLLKRDLDSFAAKWVIDNKHLASFIVNAFLSFDSWNGDYGQNPLVRFALRVGAILAMALPAIWDEAKPKATKFDDILMATCLSAYFAWVVTLESELASGSAVTTVAGEFTMLVDRIDFLPQPVFLGELEVNIAKTDARGA